MSHDDLLAAELRYDGPMPPALREQLRRTADPVTRQRIELEGIRDRAVEELKRIDGLLSRCTDEMQETFLNIAHRAQSERLKYAEIFLRRLK